MTPKTSLARRPPPPPARRATGRPPPSGGNRARAEAILAEIEQLKSQIGAGFYRMGILLRQLSHPDLYGALGFSSFGALLDARGVMSRFSAKKLIEVVQKYPPPQAKALGSAKAYILTRYAKAIASDPSELVATDAVIDGARLSELSVRALQEAAARARAHRQPRVRDAATREAETLSRRLRRWLAARGATSATLRTRWQKGAWWIRVELPAAEVKGVIQ